MEFANTFSLVLKLQIVRVIFFPTKFQKPGTFLGWHNIIEENASFNVYGYGFYTSVSVYCYTVFKHMQLVLLLVLLVDQAAPGGDSAHASEVACSLAGWHLLYSQLLYIFQLDNMDGTFFSILCCLVLLYATLRHMIV